MLINIQSINPSASSQCRWKIHELEALIRDEREHNKFPAFIALTETWLDPHIANAQVQLDHYDITRTDRGERVGGGVMLYSHESIPVTDTRSYDDGTCQGIFCEFATIDVYIILIYRPPQACTPSFSKVIGFIKECVAAAADLSRICLLGDFNFPYIDWSTGTVNSGPGLQMQSSAASFLQLLSELFLSQLVSVPTRYNNILDLFITNHPFLVTSIESIDSMLSDHRIVYIQTSLTTDSFRDRKMVLDPGDFGVYDFERGAFESLNRDLLEVDWIDLHSSCNIEEFPVLFTFILKQLCEIHIPKRKRRTGKPKLANALRRRKGRLVKRYKKMKSLGNEEQIRRIETKIHLISYEIKDVYSQDLDKREIYAISNIKENPKAFFRYAKAHSSINSSIAMLTNEDGMAISDDTSKANMLQEQFCSVYSRPDDVQSGNLEFSVPEITMKMTENDFILTNDDLMGAISELNISSSPGPDNVPAVLLKRCAHSILTPLRLMWQCSFELGVVPKFYKNSFISPLYKKGDRAKPENYRPIALTSHIIKFFERVLRKKIVHYLELNNILSHNQHGFRSGKSCLTQMLNHFNSIYEGLLQGVETDTIYLDYEKAFDKVDHRLLISKLQRYDLIPKLVKWIDSFLSNRDQVVVVNGKHSRPSKILSGVPQGSVLGPVLFVVFINDLECKIKSSVVRFFADDTKICKQISTVQDVHELQNDLETVMHWSKANNMKLHEHKFELMLHGTNHNLLLHELPYTKDLWSYQVSENHVLSPSIELRDLGIGVRADLSWSQHIQNMVNKAQLIASWVLSVFRSRDAILMLTLYKSLIRSHLEYCCPIWHPSKVGDIQKLENVQRSFTSKISGLQNLNYWDRLKKLKLLSLQRRRERYLLIQMWKQLHRRVPGEMTVQFRPESRLGIQAIVPPLIHSSRQCHRTIYENSFAVNGPRMWNAMPASLSKIDSENSFKIKLTNYLFSLEDKPPITGYVRSNNNTLIEVSGRGGHEV